MGYTISGADHPRKRRSTLFADPHPLNFAGFASRAITLIAKKQNTPFREIPKRSSTFGIGALKYHLNCSAKFTVDISCDVHSSGERAYRPARHRVRWDADESVRHCGACDRHICQAGWPCFRQFRLSIPVPRSSCIDIHSSIPTTKK
jgi:hypothetical protein